jgi:3-hydroxyacyl-CoA dehydrogenase
MGFKSLGLDINKVGVIGSGNIGPDIAIHLSRNLVLYVYVVRRNGNFEAIN